ncbi:MAG TPA: autotransporter-associated beta strand repeat-containing protein, partial [Chlamydiales bacterium]|nr:autotransporter-associated beta strand repeat-containing protein [Chlamydiales bacterium]
AAPISNGAISIGSAGTLQGTGTFALANLVSLGAGSTVDVTGANNMTLTAIISGVGGSLTKISTGTLTLSNASNSYSGGTTITGGTLSTNVAGGLGNGIASIGAAGTLQGTGTFTLMNAVTVAAGSTVDVTGANNMTLSGVVAGIGGSIAKISTGTLTLSNTGNTYSGGTTITGGTVSTNVAGALGGGTASIGAAGRLQGTGIFTLMNAVTVAAGSTVDVTSANNMTLSGVVSGVGGSIAKTSPGTLTLTNAGNTYSAGTTITGGTVSTNVAGALGNGTASIGSAGTLQGTGTFTLANAVSLAAGSTVDITGLNNVTLSGVVSGVGGTLTKTSSGILTLSNVGNTYSGGTTITGGTVSIGAAAPISSGPISIGSAGILQGTGTFTLNNAITVASGSAVDVTVGNNVTLSAAISGAGGSLTKTNSGVLTLTNAANSYTGETTVNNDGTLALSGSGALTASSGLTLNNTSTFDISQTSTGAVIENLTSTSTTFVSLGSKTLTFGSPIASSYSGVIQDGGIGGGVAGKIIKQNGGTLTLLGANTYTGLTTVSAGILAAGNNAALGGGTAGTVVDNNASLQLMNGVIIPVAEPLGITGPGLGGIGALTQASGASSTYAGPITLNANATIGTNGAGTLTLNGGIDKDGTTLILKGGGTINITGPITGPSPSSDLDVDGVTVNLTVANNYLGPTSIIDGGVINANVANALPTSIARTTMSIDLSGTGNSSLVLGASQAIQSLAGSGTAHVNLNANTLTIGTAAGSTTFAGTISGSGGSIVKDNSSTQILSGASSYSGATTVSQGVLQAGGTNAFSPNSAVTMANVASTTLTLNGFSQTILSLAGGGATGGNVSLGGGTLTLGNGSSTSYDGVISGGGGLTKIGSSTFTLTNTNSYLGGTTIAQGTISTGLAGALGSGPIAIGTSGILQITNTFTLPNTPVDLANGSSIDVTGSNGLTLSGVVTGSGGSLTKVGAGTLTLSNASNNYTGPTNINSGTLLISAPGALPSGSDVHDQGSLVFNYLGSGSYSGKITGSGSLTVQGGTIELLGKNTYSGGTLVSTGTLRGNTSSLQGAITNNAAVVFDQATNGTYAGNMSGSGGSLTKSGAGALNVTGTNTYGGPTNILSGDFAVNGSITTSTLTVSSGSTLSGNGHITGNVSNFGIVSPGNSIGLLSITGNYVQGSGSMYLVEVSPTTADRVSITGTATIEPNATLSIFPYPGSYLSTIQYIVLSSSGLTGTFSSTPNNMPTLEFQVAYDNKNVYLNINVTAFAPVVAGGNVGKVAKYLDTLTPVSGTDLGMVFGVLRFLDMAELNQALAQLHPAPYKDLIYAQEENVFSVARGIRDHLNGQITTNCRRNSLHNNRFELWTSVFGDWAQMNNRSTKGGPANVALGYHAKGGGALLGADYTFDNQCALGVMGAYSYSDVHVQQSRAQGHIDSYYGAVYAMLCNRWAFLDLACIGGYNHFDASRKIKFGVPNLTPIDRHARTKHGGWNADLHLDGGVIIDPWQVIEIRPFFALDGLMVHESSFQETGAQSLNLHVDKSNNRMLRSEAGINLSKCLRTRYVKLIPEVGASVVWETFGSGDTYRSNLVGEPGSFVVKNPNPNRTLFSPGAGLRGVFYKDRGSFSFDYNGEFGYHYHNQVGKVELSWTF